MTKRARARPPQTSTASLPAPVGGLNARDAIAGMKETDAVILDNLFPGPSDVRLRNGYVKWSTGLPGQVETLMYYSAPLTQMLFAASGTSLYDVTISGPVGAAAVTGLTNARFQHANFGTPGGSFLVAVNGADNLQRYDGSTWKSVSDTSKTISTITNSTTTATLTTTTAHGRTTGDIVTTVGQTPSAYSGTFIITVTGPTTFTYTMSSNPGGNATVAGTYTVGGDITGQATNTFIHVNVFKARLFFTIANSFKVAYLPVSSIGGAVSIFDLSSLFKLGGYLMAMANFTFRSLTGVDDYALFISSEGEIAMYEGTDPSNASSWSLVGMFRVGRPATRRCFAKVGTDAVIITADGFFQMTDALSDQQADPSKALSDKIVNLANADVQKYGANFGWQVMLYPIGNKLIFNVPAAPGSQYQYVMNTITKAWCRFTGWGANCFEIYKDNLLFGGNGFVAQCDTGNADDGQNIVGDVQQAFSYFGMKGRQKHFKMCRPIVQSDVSLSVGLKMNVDFDTSAPSSTPTYTAPTASSPWDTSKWDVSFWGGAVQIRRSWQSVTGLGFAGGIRMQAAGNSFTFIWQSTDVVFEAGGIL